MKKQELTGNAFSIFIIVMWVLTLILGHLTDIYVGKLAGISVFAGSAVCFSAIACLKANDVLKKLEEKNDDID